MSDLTFQATSLNTYNVLHNGCKLGSVYKIRKHGYTYWQYSSNPDKRVFFNTRQEAAQALIRV